MSATVQSTQTTSTKRRGRPRATPAADAFTSRGSGACGTATPHAAPAGETKTGRQAAGVDPEARRRTILRLRRIEGQVRGLQKMVEEDRYCADVLVQLSSVQEALRAVARELLRSHLRHCATAAIREGAGAAAAMYDELTDLFHRHAR